MISPKYDHYSLTLVRVYLNTSFFLNESVKAVMAQTFPPGVRNGNAGVSIGVRSQFSIRRRDNHALRVTLGRTLSNTNFQLNYHS